MANSPPDDDDEDPSHQEPDGDEGGSTETLSEDSPPGVEDTDDGGAIVKVGADSKEDEGESDFYKNLAVDLDSTSLSTLAIELLERIDFDKKSRSDRDNKYSEGIKRTGLGDEAPGGAAFEGGSTAVHPMLSKATVYYQSHTIGELMPPNGPVRDWIPGESTEGRVEKAKRKTAHMNWQFKRQMPEFRSELEKLLSQQPLAGSQYIRLVYDSRKKRPVPTFIPIDDVYLPESASDFYSAERRTISQHITQNEFEGRIRAGYYREVDLGAPSQTPDKSEAETATDKVQGLTGSPYNSEGLRQIFIVEALATIEGDDDLSIAGGRIAKDSDPKSITKKDSEAPKPYLIEVDPYLRTILSIVRNWEEDDEQEENMCWMIDFPFIPWRGAQSVGLIHIMGSLAGAGTGSLRALLDTAYVNNIPTLIKLKGNTPGQSLTLAPCTINEIEGSTLGGDIRQQIMNIPFNPPSTMLYQLLGWCTEQGEEVVRTTFDTIAQDGSPNMPVGTTLAMIEQGLKVLAAIHLRLHSAMDRVIGVLHRINRLYITDKDILDDTGEMLAHQSDYEGPVDVVPVSDPEIFSDVQRFAQLQIIQQRADLHPELYDAHKVEELILERTKIPNAKTLLKPQPQITELNQVNENLAMGLGRPVTAFPDQDHLAHIQVLCDFMESPVLGQNPLIAPTFTGPALQHLKEHILYLYLTLTVELTEHASGQDLGKVMKLKDKGVSKEMDKTLAAGSGKVLTKLQQLLTKVMPVIAAAQQTMAKFAPQPQADPTAQAVEKIKGANASQLENQKQQGQQAKDQSLLQQTNIEQQGDSQRTQAEIDSKQRINADDNATALEISAAKIETGHSTNLSTGTGIEGHESPAMGGGK